MRARSKKLSWYITWAVIDLLLLALISSFVFSLPVWRIHNVEVRNNVYISKDKIIRIARVPVNENIFLIDPADIKERFSKTVQIKDVRIRRSLPGTVVIQVTERRPFAMVIIGSEPVIVDNEGYILAKQNLSNSIYRSDIGKFPVIRGVSKKMLENGTRISEAERVFIKSTIELLSKYPSMGSIQMDISDRDNIVLYIEDILKVRIGGYGDISDKIKVLGALTGSIKGKMEKVAYIDVRVPEAPVIRYR